MFKGKKPIWPFTLNQASRQAQGLVLWGPGGLGSGNLYGQHLGRFDVGLVTPTTSVPYTDGIDGGKTAILYDGSTRTEWINSGGLLQGTANITVSAWIKMTDATRINYMMAMWGVTGDTWLIRTTGSSGKLIWITSTNNGYQSGRDLTGNIVINDGKWHLITCTYDGVNENIYIDGQLDATVAATGNMSSNGRLVNFGGLSDGSNSSDWFVGSMDDLRVYNYALPADLIAEMYAPATRWQLRYTPHLILTGGTNNTTVCTATDTPTTSESLLRIVSALRQTTEAPTLSESADGGRYYTKTAVDTPTVSETITTIRLLFRSVSQPLTITQSYLVATPIQEAFNGLTITQSVSSAGDYSNSASNTLTGLHQVADYFQFKPIAISQSLTITQVVAEVQTTGLRNTLMITQSPAYQYDPHFDQGSQLVVSTQTVTVAAIFNRTSTQTLSIIQSVNRLKIISRDVTSTLGIYQTAVGGPLRTTSNSLTLSQAIVEDTFRNKTIQNSLHVTHSVGLQMVLNRSLVSTLVFLNEHPIPDGSGGLIYVPNLLLTRSGSILNNICCPPSGATTVFQSSSRAIILPNPEYNDTESLVGAISIQRTITGGTFSYVKKSNNRKLKYKFLIGQRKAYETRKFLLDFLGERLTLNNFKGEIWSGYLLTDPAEIISTMRGDPCIGDLYSIDLEFQGVRLN